MKPQFSKGQKIIFPLRGISEVVAIENRLLGDKQMDVYVLQTETGETALVPMQLAAASGLRAVIAKKEVDEVLEILRSREVRRDNQPWNRRSREYTEKLKTGNIFEISEVVRDLNMLKTVKERLSYGETQMLELAKKRVVAELNISIGKTHEHALGVVNDALGVVPPPAVAPAK